MAAQVLLQDEQGVLLAAGALTKSLAAAFWISGSFWVVLKGRDQVREEEVGGSLPEDAAAKALALGAREMWGEAAREIITQPHFGT